MSDSLFSSMNVSAAGMSAQRTRMSVVAENIANAESTHTPGGGPYQRRQVVLQSIGSGGSFADVFSSNPVGQEMRSVRVEKIVRDPAPFVKVYNPSNPDADKNGMVSMPNVNPVMEMVDMNSAAHAFEANVTAMEASKRMFLKTLRLLR